MKLRFYQNLSVRILFSVAALVTTVELILLIFSLQTKEVSLRALRQEIFLRCQHTEIIQPDQIFTDAYIQQEVASYRRHILLMVGAIILVVTGGTYLTLRQIVIKPIQRLCSANLAMWRKDKKGATIEPCSFPKSELGIIMSSRKLMLDGLEELTQKQRQHDRSLAEEQLKVLQTTQELELQEERIKTLRATMRTVQDIVNNFLTNMQLFRMEAEERHALSPECLEGMDSLVHDTSTRLNKLASLRCVREKKIACGTGIEYESAEQEAEAC